MENMRRKREKRKKGWKKSLSEESPQALNAALLSCFLVLLLLLFLGCGLGGGSG